MTLLQELMDNDARVKADALKKIIFAILNGDKFPTLLMDIIRFVIPCSVSFLLHSFQYLRSRRIENELFLRITW